MEAEIFYKVLSIIGSFTVLALMVNAYFIKEMLASLNQVKIQTARLIEKSENKEARLMKIEREVDGFREKFHDVNNHIHQIKNIHLFNE